MIEYPLMENCPRCGSEEGEKCEKCGKQKCVGMACPHCEDTMGGRGAKMVKNFDCIFCYNTYETEGEAVICQDKCFGEERREADGVVDETTVRHSKIAEISRELIATIIGLPGDYRTMELILALQEVSTKVIVSHTEKLRKG